MPRLTIKEIAKIAEVSPSAVSIVLNGKKGVSDKTRKKVQEIVKRLNYTPNPSSRRLLFNKTNNIAVLFEHSVSPLEHLFHSELNRILLHKCETAGYNLVFTSAKVEDDGVILPNVVKSYDVDGIILYGEINPLIVSNIKNLDIPFIVIDSHSDMPDVLSVRADYFDAANKATKYLIDSGHKRIAYLGSDVSLGFGAQTFSGFKKAIEEYYIQLPANWIQMDAFDEDSAYECMRRLILKEDLPSAVFCAADIYALGAIRCIKAHELIVPDDISVIGIDDILLSRYIDPPLTTIHINKEEMAGFAFDILVNKLENREVKSKMISSGQLVIRKSVKPIS